MALAGEKLGPPRPQLVASLFCRNLTWSQEAGLTLEGIFLALPVGLIPAAIMANVWRGTESMAEAREEVALLDPQGRTIAGGRNRPFCLERHDCQVNYTRFTNLFIPEPGLYRVRIRLRAPGIPLTLAEEQITIPAERRMSACHCPP